MSEVAPDLHVGPDPTANEQASATPAAPAPEVSTTPAQDSGAAVSSAETPASVAQSASSASVVASTSVDTPLPDVDPVSVLRAENDHLQAQLTTQHDEIVRLTNEVTALQVALDAERANPAKPGLEAYVEQVGNMRVALTTLEAENSSLRAQASAAQSVVTLADATHARIKSDFLAALAEHAVPDTAPAANPFINRQ